MTAVQNNNSARAVSSNLNEQREPIRTASKIAEKMGTLMIVIKRRRIALIRRQERNRGNNDKWTLLVSQNFLKIQEKAGRGSSFLRISAMRSDIIMYEFSN